MNYRNPVWDGYLADPFCLRVEGEEGEEGPTFYAYGTGSSACGADVYGKLSEACSQITIVSWRSKGAQAPRLLQTRKRLIVRQNNGCAVQAGETPALRHLRIMTTSQLNARN